MGKNNSLPSQSRRGKKVKRFSLKPILLSALIMVSSISAIPLFNSQQVGAINTVGDQSDSNFDWRVKSLLYYRALARCFKLSGLTKADTTKISLADAKDGKWFIGTGVNLLQTSASPTVLGVYMRDATSGDTMDVGTDGIVSCDNNTFIKSALSLWGISPVEMLCNSGFRRVDIGVTQTVAECQDGSIGTDFERRDGGKDNNIAKFMAYIKRVVYGDESKEPSLSNAEWYYYYRHSIAKSCIANIATKAPGKDAVGGDNQYGYNDVKWVNESAKTVETGSYIGTWRNNETVTLRTTADPNIAPTTPAIYRLSCAEAVAEMSNNAQAYRDWLVLNTVLPQDPSSGNLQGENGSTTCAIDGIGWMICPVVTTLGDVTDGMFSFIADHFLKTDITFLQTQGDNAATFQAWGLMRNIANIAFVIVFLIIIFSQMTGVGVANYGVKKMLPRLVLGAILVNVSFFVCQLAVDLSNVLGFGLKSMFDGITGSITGGGAVTPSDVNGTEGFSLWKSIVSTVLVAGTATAALAAGLGSLVSVLIVALVAVATIFFILILRQVLIILLIVVAPLAFVAFLLPNTEKFFTQWRKLFTTLLLLFPIIGLVFGASSLASSVLKTAYADTGDTIGQVIAAGALMIPLFVVPFILKGALDGFGQLGATINKLGSGLGKSAGGRAKSGADNAYKNSRLGKYQDYRKKEKERTRSLIQSGQYTTESKSPLATMRKLQSSANSRINNSKLSGTFGDRLAASGVEASHKILDEEVAAAKAGIDNLNLTGAQKLQLATTGRLEHTDASGRKTILSSDVSRRAAIQDLMANGSVDEIHSIVNASAKGGSLEKFAQTVSLAAKAGGAGSKDPALAGAQLGEIAQGNFDYDAAVADAASKGKYTAETFARMDNTARKRALEAAEKASAGGDHSIIDALRKAAEGIRNSAEYSGLVSGNASATDAINKLLGGAGAPTTAPSPSGGPSSGPGSGTNGLILPGDDEFKIR